MNDPLRMLLTVIKWPLFVLIETILWVACGLRLYHFQVPYYNAIGDHLGDRCAYCGQIEKKP